MQTATPQATNLPGPSRTIIVQPIEQPAPAEPVPEREREPEPERDSPAPEREREPEREPAKVP